MDVKENCYNAKNMPCWAFMAIMGVLSHAMEGDKLIVLKTCAHFMASLTFIVAIGRPETKRLQSQMCTP